MTTADRNDFVPAQEKLEWVTPKIVTLGKPECKDSCNNIESTRSSLGDQQIVGGFGAS